MSHMRAEQTKISEKDKHKKYAWAKELNKWNKNVKEKPQWEKKKRWMTQEAKNKQKMKMRQIKESFQD